MTCGREGSGMAPEFWANLFGKRFGPIWTPGIVCVHAQLPRIGTSQESMGRTASSFSSSQKKDQVVASNEVLPNPCASTETLKACALIGLHLLAADYEVGSSGSQSLDLGELWTYGCPNLEQPVFGKCHFW